MEGFVVELVFGEHSGVMLGFFEGVVEDEPFAWLRTVLT